MADAPQAAPQYEWRSLGGLKTTLTWLFAANAAAALFLIAMLLRRRGTLDDLEDLGFSRRLLAEDARAADAVQSALVVWLGLALLLVIFFITWFFRAAKNNEALGRTLPRFGPGWAIGAWFIPFANFVIPVLIAQDLWRGSDPSAPRDDVQWRARSGSSLISWWWATLIVSRVSFFFGSGELDDENLTVDDIRSNVNAGALGNVLTVAAAVLAIMVVRQITERQEECLRVQREDWTRAHGEPPSTP